MSRNNKAHRKAKQKKKQSRAQLSRQSTSTPRVNDVSSNAVRLIERGSWHKALEILQDYDEAHPDDPKVLALLAEVYHNLRAYSKYCEICRRRLSIEPENQLVHLMLGGGYLGDMRPVSALMAFREFVGRWPNDPLADGARDEIERLEPVVENFVLKNFPGVGEERLRLAAANEEIIACMSAGKYARVIEIAETLLTRIGEFPAVMNNLGEACFQSGETGRAIEVAQRVAELEPKNFHALANLTRYLFLSGQFEAARAVVERLRSVRSERKDIWVKQCEALATLGDDDGVLAVFKEAEADGIDKATSPDFAVLFHLAAVAFSRRGDRAQADRWWRAALRINPNMDLVRANQSDASKRADKRHGAWYFSIGYWGCSQALDSLRKRFGETKGTPNGDEITQMVNEFVADHPGFLKLLPALLDRGDPVGRELAWRVAMKLNTPEVIDALRTFCTAQWGPDWMRIETLDHLADMGVFSELEMHAWRQGEYSCVSLLDFEVTYEPQGSPHSDQVDRMLGDALDALANREGKRAEGLLQRCLELEGESPDILNNLAASYEVQGRAREAMVLSRRIHELWPDYFFGRVAMANRATIDGDLTLARALLAPLYRQKTLHITEFAGLANAHIHLAMCEQNLESARSWLDMWKHLDPDHPHLQSAEKRYRAAAAIERADSRTFRGIFSRLLRG